MQILAIETSCDETSLAILEANGPAEQPLVKVETNIISSQIALHAPFGGVVPNIAKREHIKNLPELYQQITAEWRKEKGTDLTLDLIAVTVGPGLEPALWAGIEFAKSLGEKLKKPIIGVNHLEGHLYSFLLTQKTATSNTKTGQSALNAYPSFPAIALLVSGGHTILIKMDSLTEWKKLGETRDDAVGEAFDKVARMLGLPYPGGPEIEKLAKEGNPKAINFPRPMLAEKNYEFSFSGLKTAVLYHIQDQTLSPSPSTLNPNQKSDIASSFQAAAFEVLAKKTIRATQEFSARSILLSGGVAASKTLRQALSTASESLEIQLYVPDFAFNTDNAAMIGIAGYISFLQNKNLALKADSTLNL